MSIETMTKLATTVLSANTASVTFSSIPQGYTDLKVVWSGRQSRNEYVAAYTLVQFNSSTSGYTYRTFQADVPGTPTSQTESGVGISTGIIIGFVSNNNNTANTFGSTEMYVSNYSSSNYKTVSGEGMSENNSSNTGVLMTAGLWSNTAAITSITLSPWVGSSFNWLTHSTFTLYGVKAARTAVGNSIKAVGGNISFDGTYVVHTFNTSGTFTPSDSLRVDYLVVAGGGGGAGYVGGGGGAGGLRSTVTATGGGGSLESALSLTGGTSYTVTVGAGGNGGTASTNNATQGSNSVFSTITSTGGGKGGNGGVGGNGGSGGGGSYVNAPGSGTANQGYAGGTRVSDTNDAANGGGGAGAIGGGYTTSPNAGGAGGNGVAVAISGSSVTYAGGGGGGYANTSATVGLGGTGGGGNGGINFGDIEATAGTSNTGGGGGGAGDPGTNGKNGGSGVVIVRYRAVV